MTSYDGGKAGAGIYQTIINQIPKHGAYIECYLGRGAVLRAKRSARISVGVEIDPQVIAEHWRGDEIPNLRIVCSPAVDFLSSYCWQGDEFLYLDPPYVLESRASQRPIYRYEMSLDDHRALLTLIRDLPCPVAISGYHSPLYAEMLSSWRLITFRGIRRSGESAVECLWMNYPSPVELHDYTYLGRDFRDRERIKRRAKRWKARLLEMNPLERMAVFAAIDELRAPAPLARYDDASSPGPVSVPLDALGGALLDDGPTD